LATGNLPPDGQGAERLMRNFLGKCCVLGLIAGGFAFTGDAGRLLARGKGVIEATTVPIDASAEPSSPPPGEATPRPSDHTLTPAVAAGPVPLPPPPDDLAVPLGGTALPSEPTPGALPSADAPVGTPIAINPPPIDAPSSVEIGRLAPGDRVVVWIGGKQGRGRPLGTTIAFDVVDPKSGEVLELRHPGTTANAAQFAPCRRLRVVGSVAEGLLGPSTASLSAATIVRKQFLRLAPVAANGQPAQSNAIETIGPVLAVTVTRP